MKYFYLTCLFFLLSVGVSNAQILPADVRTTSTFFGVADPNFKVMIGANGTTTVVGYSFVSAKGTPNDTVVLACGTEEGIATATVIYQIINEATYGYVPMNFVCPQGENVLMNRAGNIKTGVLINYLDYDYTVSSSLSSTFTKECVGATCRYDVPILGQLVLLILIGVFLLGAVAIIRFLKHV